MEPGKGKHMPYSRNFGRKKCDEFSLIKDLAKTLAVGIIITKFFNPKVFTW